MRIYVTSRNRTVDSASPSDFRFFLERPIELAENAKGYLDSFVCSNTWETIIAGVNDKLYVQWNVSVPRILTLDPGTIIDNADLATKLTTGLAALDPTMKTVTVTAIGTNRIQFDCPTLIGAEQFTVYSRENLRRGYAPYATASDYADASDVVGCMTKQLVCYFNSNPQVNAAVVAISQFVSFAPYRQIYIHSHIGAPNSYGPEGSSTVIGSMIVGNTIPGDLISHHHQGLLATSIDLPPLLDSMHFTLRDFMGRIIDTDGHDISFSLVVDNNI